MHLPCIQASRGVKAQPGTDMAHLQSADTCFSICFFCTLMPYGNATIQAQFLWDVLINFFH